MSERKKITTGLYTRSEEIPDDRFRFFCAECGNPISGFPYMTTWHGWCACFDPWDFCSKECWDKSELLNPANWPPPVGKW
ncbi:MAG TPA: hypothetical protein VJO32_03470 [Ktedonobacteraceae bacterium]|nr:hypothetical protein [Ktedonobacteraceae bacterium]